MNNENLIKGNSEDEVWQQINEQFLKNPDPLEYTAVIEQTNEKIILEIDIDLGGGFESGYETTSFTAPLHTITEFRFSIHDEHFTDEIGKFFGMQDVVIGYEDFDKKLIIKTNNETKVKEIFSEPYVRSVFQSLESFRFSITTHHTSTAVEKEAFLELIIESGITDVQKLKSIYKAFFCVVKAIADTAER